MEEKQITKERSRPGSLGDLYDVLDDALPGYRTDLGHLSVRKLANALGVSTQAVYKWFNKEALPKDKVNPLIELSGSGSRSKGLTLDDLVPFVFK